MFRDPHYRHYQRYARRSLRRGGAFPVMLTGDPAGLIMLAALSKWAFRHRSAFLPFTITATALIIAAAAHRHHPHYWIAALAITSAAAVILGVPHRIIRAHPRP